MTLGGSTKADIAPFTHTEFDEFYLTLIYQINHLPQSPPVIVMFLP